MVNTVKKKKRLISYSYIIVSCQKYKVICIKYKKNVLVKSNSK